MVYHILHSSNMAVLSSYLLFTAGYRSQTPSPVHRRPYRHLHCIYIYMGYPETLRNITVLKSSKNGRGHCANRWLRTAWTGRHWAERRPKLRIPCGIFESRGTARAKTFTNSILFWARKCPVQVIRFDIKAVQRPAYLPYLIWGQGNRSIPLSWGRWNRSIRLRPGKLPPPQYVFCSIQRVLNVIRTVHNALQVRHWYKSLNTNPTVSCVREEIEQ